MVNVIGELKEFWVIQEEELNQVVTTWLKKKGFNHEYCYRQEEDNRRLKGLYVIESRRISKECYEANIRLLDRVSKYYEGFPNSLERILSMMDYEEVLERGVKIIEIK